MEDPQTWILLLPQEILVAILVSSMRARFDFWLEGAENGRNEGIGRVLRLRLVCKVFNSLYQDALFRTRILDVVEPWELYEDQDLPFLRRWPIRRNHTTQDLWHSYLIYRVLNESDPSIHRYVEVRHIAELLCLETSASLIETIKALCWLGLGTALGRIWEETRVGISAYSQDASLLSAAAFLGHVALVKRLLENGNDPTHHNKLFPSATEAAALTGQTVVLQLLQESLPDIVELPHQNSTSPRPWLYHFDLGEIWFKGKADIQGIFGAAMNGDMDILRMALYPPSRLHRGSTIYSDLSNWESDYWSTYNRDQSLLRVTSCSKNWEVYSELLSFRSEPMGDQANSRHLRCFTEYGNYDVVKRLLASNPGYPVDRKPGKSGYWKVTPLFLAARYGYDDIVDLLLERGADANNCREKVYHPLTGAIQAGSITTVRKLLKYGAICERVHVGYALLTEYTPLIELLLEQIPQKCFQLGYGNHLARWMQHAGLSSMINLLYNRGCFQYVNGEIQDTSSTENKMCDRCYSLHK